ncbi:MAG TPA: hypothetical protein VMJ66_17160, partial [Geobacteraceae bacterium]|nr:hypothetical protein [Geobacteraceae bacterium]
KKCGNQPANISMIYRRLSGPVPLGQEFQTSTTRGRKSLLATVSHINRSMKNYCGAGLRCCRSLKSSTYSYVRLAFSLACALHPGLLMTFFNNLHSHMHVEEILARQLLLC